ncbi:MAG: FAD binding domain-containing protein [Candidatus Neomarinimicrobiota bacterium]
MWSSLKTIHVPISLAAAAELAVKRGHAVFAGGSYLAAERDPAVTTLVDINHLITRKIKVTKGQIRCGAGVSLQQLIDQLETADDLKLATAARWSCASKNIRNQRTIGGEISRSRTDSELVVLLQALAVRLDRAGDRIITELIIEHNDVGAVALERFALLPSAPAFVIVAAVRRKHNYDIAVGGSATTITTAAVVKSDFTDDWIDSFARAVAGKFRADEVGSRKYKQSVVATGLRRARGVL